MRKNDAGLTILEAGDIVTKGRGKTEYRVTGTDNGVVWMISTNTGKAHSAEQGALNLIKNVRPEEESVKETSAYAKAVLFALNKLQKHVYAGTVSATKKAKNRKLNTRQKASRKANR